MDSRYDTEEWAACTTRGRHIFNYNFRMTGNELKGWELVNTVTMENAPGLTERVYIWEKKGSKGQELVRIGIAELNDWRSAQAHLHDQLRHSMRPNIPRASGKLAKTGDVSFAGSEEKSKSVAGVFFTRGNVSVTVNSVGDKAIDVTSIANMLDRAFGEPPEKEEIKKGLVQALAPPSLKVQKNRPATVLDKLPEPVPRSGWLKIVAPDGELSRQDDSVVYKSPEAGEKRIGKYVAVQ